MQDGAGVEGGFWWRRAASRMTVPETAMAVANTTLCDDRIEDMIDDASRSVNYVPLCLCVCVCVCEERERKRELVMGMRRRRGKMVCLFNVAVGLMQFF